MLSILYFSLYCIGKIVILLSHSKPTEGQEILGIGRVVDMRLEATSTNVDIPIHIVPVVVAAIEPSAAGVINVGQIVLWPRDQLAIPKIHVSSVSNSASQKDKEVSQSTNLPLPSPVSDVELTHAEDGLMNYALQCIQLGVMLMQLNDTEKEGDGERSMINWKLLMLYFRSRPRSAKYAYEAMRLITCVRALYTEKLAHRIIHGQFVNVRGGAGNNYANDLRMEMLVKTNKSILRGMCGNKTLAAVQRSTSAAYGLEKIVNSFDKECGLHPESTSHTDACSKNDIKEMITILHTVNAFKHQPGRKIRSFPKITKSPLQQLNTRALHEWLTRHKRRLAKSSLVNCDDSPSDEENDDDNDVDNEEETYDI